MKRAIDLMPGDRVRYLGSGLARPGKSQTLATGDVGMVMHVETPIAGTGLYFPGVKALDEGRDGYAVVKFESWGRFVCHIDSEGRQWEKRIKP